ncbi:hypothetical protein EDD86DRAFT_215628 [Gorgonomyces haynaldii]|nr:hypothetical protein EDD86DRAFT_215628 [Gorgonomyces haynaldii]
MSSLPLLEEAELEVTNQELSQLREQVLQQPNPQNKFNLAWGLLRSNDKQNQQLGVDLFHEIYRENPGRRRECIYYLALGEYKLGNYRNARHHNQTLLQLEPHNKQALSLEYKINEKVQSEGLVGMALVGGAAALAVGIAAAILGGKKRQ